MNPWAEAYTFGHFTSKFPIFWGFALPSEFQKSRSQFLEPKSHPTPSTPRQQIAAVFCFFSSKKKSKRHYKNKKIYISLFNNWQLKYWTPSSHSFGRRSRPVRFGKSPTEPPLRKSLQIHLLAEFFAHL